MDRRTSRLVMTLALVGTVLLVAVLWFFAR
ncbi:hypothetical protein M2152_000018 [Microbacteriaceae bacterium SG_E_30_P1]|uniref:Uncharacterized protein n=1 Tax=Antiquaquibacter oligotrophicus TaxID=2880260 RepID=A0ABT6KIY4_9MICO|nr:hypothetical protein [Antiquaquibacter oligotrophicus]